MLLMWQTRTSSGVTNDKGAPPPVRVLPPEIEPPVCAAVIAPTPPVPPVAPPVPPVEPPVPAGTRRLGEWTPARLNLLMRLTGSGTSRRGILLQVNALPGVPIASVAALTTKAYELKRRGTA